MLVTYYLAGKEPQLHTYFPIIEAQGLRNLT